MIIFINSGKHGTSTTFSVKANRSLPDDDTIKNNLIMYSLLLKRDVEKQLVEAKLLFEKYPEKPIPATTCAFALS